MKSSTTFFKKSFVKNMHFWLLGLLLIIDAVFFSNTNALKLSAFYLILGFLLVCFTIYYLIFNIIGLIGIYGLSFKHAGRLTLAISIYVSCLVAMSSINELTIKDIIVMTLILVVGYLYSSFLTNNRPKEQLNEV